MCGARRSLHLLGHTYKKGFNTSRAVGEFFGSLLLSKVRRVVVAHGLCPWADGALRPSPCAVLVRSRIADV